jgi:16S rRNA (cytosine967-C5)-methyltransferase
VSLNARTPHFHISHLRTHIFSLSSPKIKIIASFKLHKPLYQGVLACLDNIFIKKYYADKVIERIFKENKKWGSRDRAFIAETVYDMVRHWRLINTINGNDFLKPDSKYFDALLQVYLFAIKGNDVYFDWQTRMDREKISTNLKKIQNQPEVLYSVPNWLHQKGSQEFGNTWINELKALNEQAPLVIRVNTLKTSVTEIEKSLKEEEISFEDSKISPAALILNKRINVFSSEFFKEGMIEVQDEGSQLIGDFCQVKPGMRVIDACAGAGGKSMQLAALMQNKGKLIAMDIEQWKLDELKKRARRAGAFNIEPRLIEGNKTIKKLEGSADLVLLDVPCTGTGVLRRNPDAKWKLTVEFIEKITTLQAEILADYSKMVKPGGTLIYSTCSILTEENRAQVDAFLKNNQDFSFVEEKNLTPYKNGTDGFYMARLKRQ